MTVAALFLVGGLLLAYTAYQVNRHLRDAQVAVSLLRADLVSPSAPAARIAEHLATVQHESAAARALTDGPVWGAPAWLPVVGRPFVTVRGAADAVDGLATEVLPDLRAVHGGVLSGKLSTGHGSIDLEPLVAAQRPLTHATTATDRILTSVRALPETSLGPVDSARTALVSQVADLSQQLHTTRDTVDLLPAMLGAQGLRRYIVAFENNAEARGLGGLPGAYAILRTDHGKLSFERFGNDGDFNGVTVSTSGLDADFLDHYQGSAVDRVFVNSTVSPHFPYAAELMLRFWQAKTGERLDGAIATDPSALAMLLQVTGPTRLEDGTEVSAANVVALTERDAYARFTDPAIRKLFLGEVAKAVAQTVLAHGHAHPAELAKALGRAIGERRLVVYSSSMAEQHVLARYPVAGLLDDTDGLFSGVVINNGGGNKLDYYLKREVTYTRACPGPQPVATVTIKLTNTAPKTGLSQYAAGSADPNQSGQPLGTSRLLVGYYATKGAHFSHPTLDGKPTFLTADIERGRPVFTATVDIPAGATRTLVIPVDEPLAARGPVTTWVQPIVIPQVTHVRAAACGGRQP